MVCASAANAADQYLPANLSAPEIVARSRTARGTLAPGRYVIVDRIRGGGIERLRATRIDGPNSIAVVTSKAYTTASGVFNGQAWNQDENGLVLLRSDFRRYVDPNNQALAHPENPAYRVSVLGLTRTQPQEYVIEMNPPGGSDQYRYYDAKTFLVDRFITFDAGLHQHVTEFSDYRPVFQSILGMFTLPLQMDDGVPRVQASFEGVPGVFLVDTGATGTVAYNTYVSKLRSAPPLQEEGSRHNAIGGAVPAELKRLTDFEFGGIHFGDAAVFVPSSSYYPNTRFSLTTPNANCISNPLKVGLLSHEISTWRSRAHQKYGNRRGSHRSGHADDHRSLQEKRRRAHRASIPTRGPGVPPEAASAVTARPPSGIYPCWRTVPSSSTILAQPPS